MAIPQLHNIPTEPANYISASALQASHAETTYARDCARRFYIARLHSHGRIDRAGIRETLRIITEARRRYRKQHQYKYLHIQAE